MLFFPKYHLQMQNCAKKIGDIYIRLDYRHVLFKKNTLNYCLFVLYYNTKLQPAFVTNIHKL